VYQRPGSPTPPMRPTGCRLTKLPRKLTRKAARNAIVFVVGLAAPAIDAHTRRGYSPRHDAPWQREWTENQKGEFVTMANAISDALEEAVPVIMKQVEDAEQRRREQEAREKIERRRREARERAEARQRARQAAKEELRSIVKAWNDAFALDAFFTELSRRASALNGDERANLEARIQAARELAEGQDAVDRFLKWKLPSCSAAGDEDVVADETGEDHGDEDD